MLNKVFRLDERSAFGEAPQPSRPDKESRWPATGSTGPSELSNNFWLATLKLSVC